MDAEALVDIVAVLGVDGYRQSSGRDFLMNISELVVADVGLVVHVGGSGSGVMVVHCGEMGFRRHASVTEPDVCLNGVFNLSPEGPAEVCAEVG